MKRALVLCAAFLFLLIAPMALHAQSIRPSPYTSAEVATSTEYETKRVDELMEDVWSYRRRFENIRSTIETINWYNNLAPYPDTMVSEKRKHAVGLHVATLAAALSEYPRYGTFAATKSRDLTNLSARVTVIARGVAAIKYHVRRDPSLVPVAKKLLSSIESLEWQVNKFEEITREDVALPSYGGEATAIHREALRVAEELRSKLSSLTQTTRDILDAVSGETHA